MRSVSHLSVCLIAKNLIRRVAMALALVTAGSSNLPSSAPAADYLDVGFANSGANSLNLSEMDYATSMHVDSIGRIYLAGSTRLDSLGIVSLDQPADSSNDFLARYSPDGSLDTSFGGFGAAPDGVVVYDFQLQSGVPMGVVTLDDGKLITAMINYKEGESLVILTRHLENGWLDESFGQLGRVAVPVSLSGGGALALHLINDQLYAVCGDVIHRLNLDGSLDLSFAGSGGVSMSALNGSGSMIADALVHDDSILLSVIRRLESNTTLHLYQLNLNGNPMGSFGVGGSIDLSEHIEPHMEMAVLAANNEQITVGIHHRIVRVGIDGLPVASFGQNGVVDILHDGSITKIIHQPYGLTTYGYVLHSPSGFDKFSLFRLQEDGSADSSFGNTLVEGDWSGWLRLDWGELAIVTDMKGYANGKVLFTGIYKTLPDAPMNVGLIRTEGFSFEPSDSPIKGLQNGNGIVSEPDPPIQPQSFQKQVLGDPPAPNPSGEWFVDDSLLEIEMWMFGPMLNNL